MQAGPIQRLDCERREGRVHLFCSYWSGGRVRHWDFIFQALTGIRQEPSHLCSPRSLERRGEELIMGRADCLEALAEVVTVAVQRRVGFSRHLDGELSNFPRC